MQPSQSEKAPRHPENANGHSVKPPAFGYLLLEGRALGELLTTYAVMPVLRRGPRGDGHPVLVFPGFLASDVSTRPLRKFLDRGGFSAHPWLMGRNLGPRGDLEDRLLERLRQLRRRHDRKVSLVGWSLGGIYARLLANRSPQDVRCVITLGTPFNTHHKANRSWRLFEWVSGTEIDEVDPSTFSQIRNTPPVPTTSIYSLTDGVVAWRSSIDEEGPLAENIQVPGSHIGLGANPLVLHAILDRLAQPEGGWRRFERAGVKRFFYRRPRDPSPAAEPEVTAETGADVRGVEA